MAANTKLNSAALEELEKLLVSPESRRCHGSRGARTLRGVARAGDQTCRGYETQVRALNLFRTETAGLLEQYMTPFRKLTTRADFDGRPRVMLPT